MPRIFRKLAILHKMETAYGTAPTPAPAAADAIIGKNVSFTPLEAGEIDRGLLLPYMGNQGVILTGKHSKLEFDIEIAGAGAAGTAPKWASLMKACGYAETLQAATSATYSIVESNVSSSTIYFEVDGVRHVMLGCRGTMSMNIVPKEIPSFHFSMTGLLGTITDQALTPVTMAGWQTPLEASSANTTMNLHGWASVAESLSIDLGNTVTLIAPLANPAAQIAPAAAIWRSSETAADSLRVAVAGLNVTTGEQAREFVAARQEAALYQSMLDDVRASFNPLFAAQRQHENQLMRIADAERLGAISAQEAADARLRAANTLSAAMPGGAGTGVVGTHHTGNIAAQGFDTITTAAMGMDPRMIGFQQGPQFVQALQAMGGRQTGVAGACCGLHVDPHPDVAGDDCRRHVRRGGHSMAHQIRRCREILRGRPFRPDRANQGGG